MTYPDRQPRTTSNGWLLALILLALLVMAFTAEAKFRSEVCISAATIDSTGTVVSSPVICE